MIHGLMLGYLKIPFDELKKYILEYISYIDNWSMVDSIVSNLKIFNKYEEEGYNFACELINSNNEFSVRFGYCILHCFYINEKRKKYLNDILKLCNKKHHHYYVQMMVAWLLSIAYVKFKEDVLQFIYNNELDDFTFNKMISKICDSFQIEKEDKNYLRTLRRK